MDRTHQRPWRVLGLYGARCADMEAGASSGLADLLERLEGTEITISSLSKKTRWI